MKITILPIDLEKAVKAKADEKLMRSKICPVAQALKRVTHRQCWVGNTRSHIVRNNITTDLINGPAAKSIIYAFDNDLPVLPMLPMEIELL